MNERKWLTKEGPKWVEKGLIQKEQLDGILSIYGNKSNNLLPILASILIGLGVLTFVASNWGEMSDVFRLTLLCAALVGFHSIGAYQVQKGSLNVGVAWIGIGTLSFGAGIFLTAQMFHIVSYNASAFILWTLFSLLTYLVLPNKYFYLLTLTIGTSGVIYSSVSLQSFSFLLAFLVIVGIGALTFKEDEDLFYQLYALSVSITSITFLVAYDLTYIWMTLVFLFLYGVSEVIQKEKVQHAFKNSSIIGIILLTFAHVFLLDDLLRYDEVIRPDQISYFLLLVVFVGMIAWSSYSHNKQRNWIDLILFAPLFLIGENADIFYLLLAFGYSLYILVQGYQEESPSQINRGTFLFLISTLVAYIQLAWAFLPKSMFFLAGGILLLILSWYLERRRRDWLHHSKGGQL